jgi:hypothetical protein
MSSLRTLLPCLLAGLASVASAQTAAPKANAAPTKDWNAQYVLGPDSQEKANVPKGAWDQLLDALGGQRVHLGLLVPAGGVQLGAVGQGVERGFPATEVRRGLRARVVCAGVWLWWLAVGGRCWRRWLGRPFLSSSVPS